MPIIWITCGFFAGVITAEAVSIRLLYWVLIGLGGTLIVAVILWVKTPGRQDLFHFPRRLI